jgi:hypothetical protein
MRTGPSSAQRGEPLHTRLMLGKVIGPNGSCTILWTPRTTRQSHVRSFMIRHPKLRLLKMFLTTRQIIDVFDTAVNQSRSKPNDRLIKLPAQLSHLCCVWLASPWVHSHAPNQLPLDRFSCAVEPPLQRVAYTVHKRWACHALWWKGHDKINQHV